MRRAAAMLRQGGPGVWIALALALGLPTDAVAQITGDPIGDAVAASSPPVAAAPPLDEEAAESMTAAPAGTPPPAAAAAPIQDPAPAAASAPLPLPLPSAPAAPATQTYTPLPPPPAGLPYARPPQAYAAPPSAYVRPGPPTATTPVHIEDTSRTPDRPLSAYDMNYDARLRASSASAQGMLGPLNGSWTLNVPGVGDVYVFELVDNGYGFLEGAWRDLRRIGAMGASGFVDNIQRQGATLTFRFSAGERLGVAVATLTAQSDGRWTGELAERGERKAVILMRRN